MVKTADPSSSLTDEFSHLSFHDPHVASDSVFPSAAPALVRISPKRDVISDDDHRPLDAKTIRAFALHRKLNQQPNFADLLNNITSQDKRLVTLTADDAEKLLGGNPSITGVLRKAWDEGSFKDVRRLGMFLFSYSGQSVTLFYSEILWPLVPKHVPSKSLLNFLFATI